MKTSRVLLVLSIVLFASCGSCGLLAAVLSAISGRGGGNADSKPAVKRKADAATQAERSKLLDALMLPGGAFERIDKRGLWVNPAFYLLPYDEKRRAVRLAWLYCFAVDETAERDTFDSFGQLLTLLDSRTGKRVGYYSDTGLHLE